MSAPVRKGRTGDVLCTVRELDTLPNGTIVVPLWLADPTDNGQHACVKFAGNEWYSPLFKDKLHPLGPSGHVRVVYDPRDEKE